MLPLYTPRPIKTKPRQCHVIRSTIEYFVYTLMVFITIVVILFVLLWLVDCVVLWPELRCADIPSPIGEKVRSVPFWEGEEYDTGL